MVIYLFNAIEQRGTWQYVHQLAFRDRKTAKEELTKFADRMSENRPMVAEREHPRKGEYVYSAYNCDDYFYVFSCCDDSDYAKAWVDEMIVLP